jgi:hypothetical protein
MISWFNPTGKTQNITLEIRMEIEDRILEEIHLENGLTVYLVDQSRPIVGGRWQVQLLVRVPLEAKAAHFEKLSNPSEAFREFIALAGEAPLEFQIVKVRNFIDESRREDTLEQMKADFTRSALAYVKKPGFAASYILKKFEELRGEKASSQRRKELGG